MKRTTRHKNHTKAAKPDPNQYPEGWDRKRVEEVIAHYEGQTDDEAVAEDEAAYRSATQTMMQVPLELVPDIRRLIASNGSGTKKTPRPGMRSYRGNVKK